jgi:hypothetical protein
MKSNQNKKNAPETFLSGSAAFGGDAVVVFAPPVALLNVLAICDNLKTALISWNLSIFNLKKSTYIICYCVKFDVSIYGVHPNKMSNKYLLKKSFDKNSCDKQQKNE